MADIAMCTNKTCELNHGCYRFQAIPNPRWQTYSDFKPDESGECHAHWLIEPDQVDFLQKEKDKRKNAIS